MNLKKTLALGLALSGLMMAQAGDAPDYKTFAKRLTVTPSAAALEEGLSYADVPVLLRLSEKIADFSYDDFKADGQDLMFVDETFANLSFEIQSWNPESESLVWVKVPHWTPEAKSTMLRGSTETNTANVASDTWSGYAGAWHFDAVSEGAVADSTAQGYAGTLQTRTSSIESAPLGKGLDLATVDTTGYGGVVFNGTTAIMHGGTLTLGCWVSRHAVNKCWDHLFYRKATSGGWNGFASELYGDKEYGQISILGQDGNGSGCYLNHGIANAEEWYYVMLVYDGLTARLYNNGVKIGSGTMKNAATDNGGKFSLGIDNDANGTTWNGCVDEFRVICSAFDDTRAALEYKLQAGDAMGYSVGDNVATCPEFGAVAIRREADGYHLSASMTDGRADSITAVVDGAEINLLSGGSATAGWSIDKVLDLPADLSFTCTLKATNTDGFVVALPCEGAFYTGKVSATGAADAFEDGLRKGAFVFSRAAADTACTHELVVNYTVGGTAVAGTDYVALSGTATIPAGEASVTVSVEPLPNIWTDEDVTVVLSVAEGAYAPSAESATIKVHNCRNAALSSFTRRTTIAFPGYDRDETLSGFPVLIRLSEKDDTFSYADIERDDHKDLAFFDGTGAQLPHEIDTWDENGESLIWVRVRELKRGATIAMCYGGGNAFDNDPQKTWSDYVGVWHLNDAGEGANVAIADSSAHQLHGTTPTNAEKIDPDGNKAVLDGKIGGARKIATKGGPAELGRILVKNNDNKDLYTGRKVSVSIWFRFPVSENWGYLIDRKARDDYDTWGIQFGNSSNVDKFRLYSVSETYYERSYGAAFSTDEWHHVFVVWNEGKQSMYVDGVAKTVDASIAQWIQDQKDRDLAIGGLVNDNSDKATWGVFPGDLDEARVSGVVRDTAWALTEYATVTNAEFAELETTEPLSNTKPAVAPVTYDENAKTVAFPLLAGSGDIYAIVRLPNGSEQTNLVASGVVAPKTTAIPLSSLPKAGWIDVRLLAVQSETGAYDERDWSVHAYNHPKPSCIKLAVNGYDGEEVANFPALVRISQGTGGFDPSVLFDREAGSDVWFTDEGGNVLPYEREAWDPDGESVYWVRMPKLAVGAKIFVNYGSDTAPEAASDATRAEVWSDQNCVWHAEQSATGHFLNSAQESMDNGRGWDNSTSRDDGVVCNGRQISNGNKGDKWGRGMQFGKNDLFKNGNAFTVSLWFKYKKDQAIGYDRLIAIKESYNSGSGWEVSLVDGNTHNLQIRGASETATGDGTFENPLNDGEWHYLTVVYAGEAATVYENGVYRMKGKITPASNADLDLVIGNNSKRNEVDFKGTVDEIRLGAGELSADRIKADYLTVTDKSFFTATPYSPGFIVIIK